MSTQLTAVHIAAYWSGFGLLVAQTMLYLSRNTRRRALPVGIMGFALLLVAAAARWIETGHPPIFGGYENSLAAALSVGFAAIILHSRWGRSRAPEPLAGALSLWALPLLIVGLFFDRTPLPLTISERSLLVDVHVLFAWGAHAVLLTAATAAVLLLVYPGIDRVGLQSVMFRSTGMGFASLTLMIAVGSVYSFLLFSDWYRWEIVETLAAASWLAYASVVHAVMFFGWRERKLAWVILAVTPLLIITFWSWNFYAGTYHHFEVPDIRAQ